MINVFLVCIYHCSFPITYEQRVSGCMEPGSNNYTNNSRVTQKLYAYTQLLVDLTHTRGVVCVDPNVNASVFV